MESGHALDAAKQGSMRRGRETRQLDLGYPGASLALQSRERDGVRAGERASDAPMRGRDGQPTRLFALFHGPHWTLLGCEADRALIPTRPGLRVHVVGGRGDVIDDGGRFRHAYGLAPGEWALIRPDGYIGAIVGCDCIAELERCLARVGLAAPCGADLHAEPA